MICIWAIADPDAVELARAFVREKGYTPEQVAIRRNSESVYILLREGELR